MKKRKIRKITRKKPNRRLRKSRKRTNRPKKTKRKTKTKKPTKKRKRIIIKGGGENMGTLSIYDQLSIKKDHIHYEHIEFVVDDINMLYKTKYSEGDLEIYKNSIIERLYDIEAFTKEKISNKLDEVISFITGKLNFLLPNMESEKKIIVNNIIEQLKGYGPILYSFTSEKEKYNKLINARYKKDIETLENKIGDIDSQLDKLRLGLGISKSKLQSNDNKEKLETDIADMEESINSLEAERSQLKATLKAKEKQKQTEKNRWKNVFNSINEKIESYKYETKQLDTSLKIIEKKREALIDLINSVQQSILE